jgi:hypothetical protein
LTKVQGKGCVRTSRGNSDFRGSARLPYRPPSRLFLLSRPTATAHHLPPLMSPRPSYDDSPRIQDLSLTSGPPYSASSSSSSRPNPSSSAYEGERDLLAFDDTLDLGETPPRLRPSAAKSASSKPRFSLFAVAPEPEPEEDEDEEEERDETFHQPTPSLSAEGGEGRGLEIDLLAQSSTSRYNPPLPTSSSAASSSPADVSRQPRPPSSHPQHPSSSQPDPTCDPNETYDPDINGDLRGHEQQHPPLSLSQLGSSSPSSSPSHRHSHPISSKPPQQSNADEREASLKKTLFELQKINGVFEEYANALESVNGYHAVCVNLLPC